MPKVLFLTCWYPSGNDNYSGIFIKEHARAVISAGADLCVLHYNVKKSNCFFRLKVNRDKNDGINYIELKLESVFWNFFYQMPLILWLIIKYKILVKALPEVEKAELIHSHVIFPAGMLGYRLSEKLGVPHLISEHWSKTENFLSRSIYSHWAKQAYLKAEAIFPVSEFLSQSILKACPNLTRISIIPNIVDTATFHFTEKYGQDKVIFVSVTNMRRTKKITKRPDLIIEALYRIQQKHIIDFELVMIGDGNLKAELQKKCKQAGINARFPGFLSKSEISEFMQKATYFIHASDFETFGIVVFEALGTGTPVIASKIEAFRSIINDQNGVLCKNSIDEWVNGIIKAISISYNHRLIAEMVKDKYSYNAVGEAILKEYRKIMNNNRFAFPEGN